MENAATRKRKSRARMTEEEKRAARAADAERKRKRRKENSAETREHARKENRLQQQARRRVADEEAKEGVREYDRLYRQDRRQAEVGYSSHRIAIEKSTRLSQSNPPDGEELLFHERDKINSLLMYHHRSGVEFVLPALQYVELRHGKLLLLLFLMFVLFLLYI